MREYKFPIGALVKVSKGRYRDGIATVVSHRDHDSYLHYRIQGQDGGHDIESEDALTLAGPESDETLHVKIEVETKRTFRIGNNVLVSSPGGSIYVSMLENTPFRFTEASAPTLLALLTAYTASKG